MPQDETLRQAAKLFNLFNIGPQAYGYARGGWENLLGPALGIGKRKSFHTQDLVDKYIKQAEDYIGYQEPDLIQGMGLGDLISGPSLVGKLGDNFLNYAKEDPASAIRMGVLESLLPGKLPAQAAYGGLDALGHSENIGLGALLGGTLGKVFNFGKQPAPDFAETIIHPNSNKELSIDDVIQMGMFPKDYYQGSPNLNLDERASTVRSGLRDLAENLQEPDAYSDLPNFTKVPTFEFKRQGNNPWDYITPELFREAKDQGSGIVDVQDLGNSLSYPYRAFRAGEFDLIKSMPEAMIKGENYDALPEEYLYDLPSFIASNPINRSLRESHKSVNNLGELSEDFKNAINDYYMLGKHVNLQEYTTPESMPYGMDSSLNMTDKFIDNLFSTPEITDDLMLRNDISEFIKLYLQRNKGRKNTFGDRIQ